MNVTQNLTGSSCQPIQILSLNIAINDLSKLQIFNDCDVLYTDLEYAYSTDGACWTCYANFDTIMESLVELTTDFYVRAKVSGVISKVLYDNEPYLDYSTQLMSGFNFTSCATNQNTYNPYANMDCAIALNQQMAEMVSCIAGIPIYYFKVSGVQSSKDVTFKEYALKSVTSVKQIKMIVADGQMPSSKPEFADFAIDFQSDWETEITKGTFATAFGPTAQPTEGDLIYVPLMKRMWMVNEAYEEKKDAFMWNATSFKLALVKYQDDSSVNLADSESLINDIVKNKYEDLFGEEENLESSEESSPILKSNESNLYAIYKSDANRKYISCEGLDVVQSQLYYKGTMVCDNAYSFNMGSPQNPQVIYQRQYCGGNLSISFIIKPTSCISFDEDMLTIGNIKIKIKQKGSNVKLSVINIPNMTISISIDKWYFVVLRWSKDMMTADFTAYEYKYPENIPIYKLQNHHYYFDIDNPISQKITKWNTECAVLSKGDITLRGFYGTITNIKLFDIYNSDISELMQQYPSNHHLLVNDVARPLIGLSGISM